MKMVQHVLDHHFGPSTIPLAIGLFLSVSALVAFLCARHGRAKGGSGRSETETTGSQAGKSRFMMSPFSKKNGGGGGGGETWSSCDDESIFVFDQVVVGEKGGGGGGGGGDEEGGFGEGGLWQKRILMGEKCQPPVFTGVIYYDSYGNQLPEFPPRSPRASPLPSFSSKD